MLIVQFATDVDVQILLQLSQLILLGINQVVILVVIIFQIDDSVIGATHYIRLEQVVQVGVGAATASAQVRGAARVRRRHNDQDLVVLVFGVGAVVGSGEPFEESSTEVSRREQILEWLPLQGVHLLGR